MSKIRLLSSDGATHGPLLAGHLRQLQRDGPVVFVTADRTVASWTADWAAASVDLQRMHVIDAVSAMNGTQPARGPTNAHFLPSPAMLEMMALRIEQLIRRHAPVRVIIDSLDALALYNGVPAVQAFGHYLANRLRGGAVGADLVVRSDAAGQRLAGHMSSFVDERAVLGAPQALHEAVP